MIRSGILRYFIDNMFYAQQTMKKKINNLKRSVCSACIRNKIYMVNCIIVECFFNSFECVFIVYKS